MTPDRKVIGARLRAAREERQWGRGKLAYALQAAARELKMGELPDIKNLRDMIKQHECGRHAPGALYRPLYAHVFGTTEAELFGERPPTNAVNLGRRDALVLLGAAGALEPIRLALVEAVERNAGQAAGDWEEIAYEYGHTFLIMPPKTLLPDLAADLTVLQEAIQSARSESLHRRLCSPGSKLMALVAMTLSTLGERRLSRHWWSGARRTADASGVRDLRVWIRGYEAMAGLYAGRAPAVVLKRSQEAIALAGDTDPCPAVLEAMAARAQVLAMTGRADPAEEAVNTIARRFDVLAPAEADDRLSTNAWPETALRHTQAYVYTHTGNKAAAHRAQDAALALYPASMPRQRTQIELLRATCLIRQGGILDGLRHAHGAVQQLEKAQATATIRRGTAMVVSAVPEAERSRPSVAAYCEELASPLPAAN